MCEIATGPDGMLEAFRSLWPDAGEPVFLRVPGRVNIIGEHLDYNGLPVLPMAIERSVCVAAGPGKDGTVELRNTDPAFPPLRFANGREIPPSPTGSWENYCKAAIQGLNDRLKPSRFQGVRMLVSGDIPRGAGLSSSSALVVASALAYLKTGAADPGAGLSPLELAELLAEAEHYVGTRGGGMDQAVILLAEENMACKIDFFPVRVEHVPLPRGWAFVVCNSMTRAEKTGAMLHRYNEGPRLCSLIAALVERRLRDDLDDGISLARLGDLWNGHLCMRNEEVADLIDDVLPRERMSLREAAALLELPGSALRERWLGDMPEPPGGFPLKARARHQLTEFARVEAARDAMLAGDAWLLGELMLESHASCAADYEVSCPELDDLVAYAREAGAAGARLTGAGFGGCTVNLVPLDLVESFKAHMHRRFYAPRGIAPVVLNGEVIATRAARGAVSWMQRA